MFPIDTKAEKPRPRSEAFSSSASPRAPLWDEKRDRAGRQRPRAEGRVEAEARNGDTEAVRPDEASPVRAHQAEQELLALAALGADLGEAGGDDAERLDSTRERRLGGLEHQRAGQADDGEVDDLGYLSDGSVRAHAGDRLSAQVDGIGRTGEVGGEDVSEELAADRAAAARSTDHGDRPRLEEGAEGGGHGEVVALVDARAVQLGGRDREANLEFPAVQLSRHLEPAPAKTPSIARLSGRTSARKRSMPWSAASAASRSSRRVPIP